MRIITGRAKGVRLETLDGIATRPTSERVKEALFSSLQFDIADRRVLDLFSGSGQLALEALSRGASYAVMVDRSRDAVKIIKQNIAKTKLSDLCEVHNCEFKDYILKNKGKKFDIVFIDPPYAMQCCTDALVRLCEAGILLDGAIAVLECGDEEVDTERLKELGFECTKSTSYGKKTALYIFILHKKA